MSMSIHCTLFLTLAALLLSSFCIRSAPAAASPSSPPFFPAACQPPPSPSCPVMHHSMDTTLSLSNQSCLRLHTNLSPFTIDFTDELLVNDHPPSLVFALVRSPPPQHPFMKLNFHFGFRDAYCATAEQQSLLTACVSQDLLIQKPTNSSCKNQSSDSFNWEETLFNYSVSLTYDATAVDVEAKVNYGGGFEINQTFVLNATDLQPDDNIGLIIDYVTRGNATINISTMNDALPSPFYAPSSLSDPLPPHENNSKSTHTTLVVWIIVGVSIVAFVVVLMILALTIKKHYRRRRPSLGPPSRTTRAPSPHPGLESSATPMMTTLCLSPPYHTDNFQISGTASWLKQPNPR